MPDMFLIKGIQQQIRAQGKILMIADIDNKPGQPGQMEPLIRTFMEHRAEGILYVAGFHQEVLLPEVLNRCPMVLVNCFDFGRYAVGFAGRRSRAVWLGAPNYPKRTQTDCLCDFAAGRGSDKIEIGRIPPCFG